MDRSARVQSRVRLLFFVENEVKQTICKAVTRHYGSVTACACIEKGLKTIALFFRLQHGKHVLSFFSFIVFIVLNRASARLGLEKSVAAALY